MIFETVVGVVCVLLGLLIIAVHFAPDEPASAPTPALERARLAHSLGLGHRLAARAIRSSYMPADAELGTAAALYQLSAVRLPAAHVELASPLLEVEQLWERVDRISARARSWSRRGRIRGAA